MWVTMYSPERGYGFVTGPSNETIFFSADAFERLVPGGPPPLVGEAVIVEGVEETHRDHPRALRVRRQARPLILNGRVKKFDVRSGWGFVVGSDKVEYFLHRSDIIGKGVPVEGSSIVFYPCTRKSKPRACHVTLHG